MGIDFCRALEDRGYVCLIAVGFGTRPDGAYSVKVAASPALRSLSSETWATTLRTIYQAIDLMHSTPMDDMETDW